MKRVLLAPLLVVSLFAACGSAQIRLRTTTPVNPALVTITSSCIPDQLEDIASVGRTATATGGTPPYTWSNTVTLPTGITRTLAEFSGTPTTPGTYNYTYTATDSVAMASLPKVCTTIISAAGTLPSPWDQTDIGSPAIVGTGVSSGDASGPLTITGSDTAFGNSDKFHFVYQPVTGNQYIKGRITGCTTSGVFGQRCAFEARQALTTGSVYGMVGRGTTPKSIAQWRTVVNDDTTSADIATGSYEYFLLTVYLGDVSFYYSTTGLDGPWVQLGGTVSLGLTGTYYIGMPVYSSSTGNVATGTYTGVEVGAFVPPNPVADYGGYRAHYQGFGANSVGGRGGVTCAVNSLADTATVAMAGGANNPEYRGTLRGCVKTLGLPVIVVFETSGTIVLTSELVITQPYQTWAGQTAPSPGITIEDRYQIRTTTHDLVFQHLRFRHGDVDPQGGMKETLWIQGGSGFNIVLDHMSLSWGCHMNISIDPGNQDILLTHVILSEPLYNPLPALCNGSGNSGGMNFLFQGESNETVSIDHSLITNSTDRNPLIPNGARAMMVNTIIYNWSHPFGGNGPGTFICGTNGAGAPCYLNSPYEVVLMGNMWIPGPGTGNPGSTKGIQIQGGVAGGTVYIGDNVGPSMTDASANCTTGGQWGGVDISNVWVPTGDALTKANICQDVLPAWFTVFNIVPHSVSGDNHLPGGTSVARAYVQANVGARPYDRDSVDTRVAVTEINAGTGTAWITSQTVVGGFPTLAVNTRTTTGQIPSNPNSVAAGQTFRTNIEVWLESNSTFGATRSGVEAP